MADKESKYDRAAALAAEKKYDEAIALYNALICDNPAEDSLRLALAWVYRDSGQLAEAVSLFEELLEKELARKVFTGFAFDELVRIYAETGDFQKQIAICRRAVDVQPDDVGLLFTLGDALAKSSRHEEAAEVFEKLSLLEPDSTAYLFRLGSALVASGDFERAERAYERAVEVDPQGAAEYYHRIGRAYLDREEYGRAQTFFTKAINHRSDEPIYYCGLGDAYLKQGKMDEAESAYENAVRIDPGRRAAYYNRFGHGLIEAGRHADAVRIFRKAISADPKNPFLYVSLAKACEAQGLDREAKEAFRMATTPGEDS